jgi:hypothetical protein
MLTDKYADSSRRILGVRTALRHIIIKGLCVLNAHVVIHLLRGYCFVVSYHWSGVKDQISFLLLLMSFALH